MNKQLKYLLQHRAKRKKGDTAQLLAQLAPLEEQDRQAAARQVDELVASRSTSRDDSRPGLGSIVIDKTSVKVPQGIGEGQDERAILGIERVVLVIVGLMLAFIVFIGWQISLMPVE